MGLVINYMHMKKTIKKIFLLTMLLFVAALVIPAKLLAAPNGVAYDPSNKSLEASGPCQSDVSIIMYKKSTTTAWGSFSAPCTNNQFTFSQKLTDWNLDEGDYDIQIIDAVANANKKKNFFNQFNNNSRTSVHVGNLEPPEPLVSTSTSQDASASTTQATTTIGIIGLTSLSSTTEQTIADQNIVIESMFGIVKVIEESIVRITTLFVESVRTTLIATVQLFTKNLTVLPQGNVSLPFGDNQVSGHGQIESGTDHVFISNTQVTVDSRIILTPLQNAAVSLAVTKKITNQGFEVSIGSITNEPLAFDWVLFQSYNANPNADPNIPQVDLNNPVSPVPDPVNVVPEAPSTSTDENVALPSSTPVVEPAAPVVNEPDNGLEIVPPANM